MGQIKVNLLEKNLLVKTNKRTPANKSVAPGKIPQD